MIDGKPGFTMAELLVALVLLAIVAAFAMPKVLVRDDSAKVRAVTLEAAGMISQAFQTYMSEQEVTARTSPLDLLPYMNYVDEVTTGSMTDVNNNTWACNDYITCIRLTNGADMGLWRGGFGGLEFGRGTGTSYSIWFLVDPDGDEGTDYRNNIWFGLYPNGELRTLAHIYTGTVFEERPGGAIRPLFNGGDDPPWWHDFY